MVITDSSPQPGQGREGTTGTSAGADASAGAGSVALALRSVSKSFVTTQVLFDVDVEVRPGEVLALIGENGAGKSTSVKILGGVHRPDGGSVVIDGQPVVLRGPLDAFRRGIAVVNQHPALFPELSIAENVFAGHLLRSARGPGLDHRRMRRETARHLATLGLPVDPATPVSTLSASQQQLIEVARALASDAHVVILDEPTAALSSGEVDRLFAVVDMMRRRGTALLFVGHRLEEVFRIADRIEVLRDGHVVAVRPASELTEADVVKAMVGRELGGLYPQRRSVPGGAMLQVTGLAAASGLADIDVTVHEGEIVGLAGLVGSGRTELARVIFGVDRPTAGSLVLDGRRYRPAGTSKALAHGIAYVSEDRGGQSLIGEFSILDNATLPVVDRATRFGLVFRRLQIALVDTRLKLMNLRFRDYQQPVSELSGGNQQKVVLAKWLSAQPKLLILDEPTQGVDVGAKAEVHRIVADLAEQGMAILMISSDMPEVLGMSDRVIVMRRGRIAAEFAREDATQEGIAAAAAGASASTTDGLAPASVSDELVPGAASDAPAATPPARGAVPPPGSEGGGAGWLRVLLRRREVGLLAVLLAAVVIISVINPRFLGGNNLASVASNASLVGLVALGELLVVLTRNIDVSVGSTIGLTAYIFGSLAESHPSWPIVVAIAAAIGVGLVCGAINGAVVAYGNVPSIVVTLGTMYIYRGYDSIISNGHEIAPGDIPQGAVDYVSGTDLGIPRLLWICVVAFAIAGLVLRWTRRGREFYQVGSNPDGAGVLGIPLRRRVFTSFLVSGGLAGLVGALWAMYYAVIDGNSAYGFELTVIAAVVVGGVALRGGYGTVVGVALGAIALYVIQNALNLANVNSNDLQAFYGAAILLAVAFDLTITHRRRTRVAV